MNLSTAHIPVTFKVHYATRWGQIVTVSIFAISFNLCLRKCKKESKVIGDDEAFGKWNTKKGAYVINLPTLRCV